MSSLRSARNAPSTAVALEAAEQRAVNQTSLLERNAYATHRAKVTELVAAAAAGRERPGRLCVLGAGNCNDLDLTQLSQHYAEIHLVDIDGDAIATVIGRADEATRPRLRAHAPLDLSGILERLERWKACDVTPHELFATPAESAQAIADSLPGPFDVVLSACLLTQLQLTALRALTDRHRLFEAARQIVNLIHLRSISKLLAVGGHGLLVTDATSDQICELGRIDQLQRAADRVAALGMLAQSGNLFYAVEPGLLQLTCRADLELSRTLRLEPIKDAWLWRNGPQRTFLSYALELERVG